MESQGSVEDPESQDGTGGSDDLGGGEDMEDYRARTTEDEGEVGGKEYTDRAIGTE